MWGGEGVKNHDEKVTETVRWEKMRTLIWQWEYVEKVNNVGHVKFSWLCASGVDTLSKLLHMSERQCEVQ